MKKKRKKQTPAPLDATPKSRVSAVDDMVKNIALERGLELSDPAAERIASEVLLSSPISYTRLLVAYIAEKTGRRTPPPELVAYLIRELR